MDDLRRQFDYYVEHQDELVKQYDGKWIVLADNAVVQAFDSQMDAYKFARENCEPETFLIQFVAAGQENHSQTFHSRVAI